MKQKSTTILMPLVGLVLIILFLSVACTGLSTTESSMPPTFEPPSPTNTAIPSSTAADVGPDQERPVAAPPQSIATTESEVNRLIAAARADLGARLGLTIEEISILSVEAVEWPDASLGCPQPDMMYAQVLQDGMLIQLAAAGRVYSYHSGGGEDPFLCEDAAQMIPQVTPKYDELNPPPGSELD